ncbi:response regulator [Sphingomonas quercus]|uniref:Response regulator n=1 Tax=Sphingomonas quercus TaxID=2842451 RepID=A0ABS6BGL1_9SPHN|nr:response regulator [Sphingomonas quercus]MBU3077431.1 response regulator [Sphingomonas quercus]
MGAARRILLVEDEPLIAMMLEDLLATLGHEVVGSVDNVGDALVRVAEGGFDYAVLDVHLRDGESCWPVADALSGAGIPFVLASGGSADVPPEAHRNAPVLSKPFTGGDVERVVGAV